MRLAMGSAATAAVRPTNRRRASVMASLLNASLRPGAFLRSSIGRRKQPVLAQELDHEAIEQPGLLDLAGMAGAMQDPHLAAGNARLQGERALMRAILAA